MKVSQRLQKFNTGHSEGQYIRAIVKNTVNKESLQLPI